ncbi:MAG: polyribonucleotide nucleotidyltransferase [Candidatus Krumholzibacteriota bacterium]|nr:polyribonucleotide nucleotidyltransferase [Candidatus Krumholzibacteriota bacterium]
MIRKNITIEDRELFFETGRIAKQADGSVLLGESDTTVLVTAVASKGKETDKDFFPLFVEYREKFYAAGKIPGGFFKREGKPGDHETVSCRLIDRPIRPLFPDNFNYEVQVACSVLSADQKHQADVLGIIGASLALNMSEIPFETILSGVRVGIGDDGYIINPTFEEVENGNMDIIVAGSDDAILMVEGGTNEISEDKILEILDFAHSWIRKLNAFQREFLEDCDIPEKRKVLEPERDAELVEKLRDEYTEEIRERSNISGKLNRERSLSRLCLEAVEKYSEEYPEAEKEITEILHEIEREIVRDLILNERVRTDGRKLDDIRDITCEVGVMPQTHGSALFTRGETQSLVAVTLGTSQDQQRVDAMRGESWKRFLLHYNFPPYSVGEVGFFRGPGRREIGHGLLAERSLTPVIPSEEDFPYTIRVVSDIMESNGSSSMATVCGGTLALMDAGVPMKKPLAGVAMGLVMEGDNYAILTDILGLEDHLGDMDFKVVGSKDGITAFQMDTKISGVSREVMAEALEQARKARVSILDKMLEVIPEPRADISPKAPKIVQIQIPVDKIREIIGPGGKVIRHIQEESGAKVDIDDDGTVQIAAVDKESGDKALEMVERIIEEPELNKVYKGVVKSVVKFGAFVEVLPGKDGLLHISEIANERIGKVEDVLNVGDELDVKIIGIDDQGKIRLSRKVLL